MRCLGEQVSALVDGALRGEARESALAHIAGCSSCRAEVESERATKSRVAALRPPVLTDELRARLLGLATRPLCPPSPPVTLSPRPALLRPARAAFASVEPTRWPRLAVAGAVAAGLGAALAATVVTPVDGPGGGSGHVVQPAGYVRQHDATTVGLLQDPFVPAIVAVSLR
jgi:anti-sigma factor RsiW